MRYRTVSRKSLLVNGDDQVFRTFVHDLLSFGARLEAIREGFGATLGLSGSAYTCLMAISFLQTGEGTGINGVAKHLHLSPAFVTLEVAKLVESGLVLKQVNFRDRRRVLLTLSPNGQAMLASLSPAQIPVNDALFSCITRADFQFLQGLMPKLVQSSEQALALLKPHPAQVTARERPRR